MSWPRLSRSEERGSQQVQGFRWRPDRPFARPMLLETRTVRRPAIASGATASQRAQSPRAADEQVLAWLRGLGTLLRHRRLRRRPGGVRNDRCGVAYILTVSSRASSTWASSTWATRRRRGITARDRHRRPFLAPVSGWVRAGWRCGPWRGTPRPGRRRRGEVERHRGKHQPGGVRGELSRGQVRQRPGLELGDDLLDDGVVPVGCLRGQHRRRAVGEHGVMPVLGEQRGLPGGHRVGVEPADPAHDQPGGNVLAPAAGGATR
jgi:hypothetical protein